MLRKSSKDKNYKYSAQKRSPEQEQEMAELIGGEKIPGSGSKTQKGDVRKKGIVRIENKTTSKKSFRVTREMIDKIEEASLQYNELPIIEVEFFEEGRPYNSVLVIPKHALLGILEGIDELY